MAPSYDLDMSDSSSEPASPGKDNALLDDVSALEQTYQKSKVSPGPEYDFFASELDRCENAMKGTRAEKRGQVFKLLESYHGNAQARANRLLDQHRRAKSRKGGARPLGQSTGMDMDVAVKESDEEETKALLRDTVEEVQTWDLLRRLLPLRYQDAPASQPGTEKRGDGPLRTRKQYWNEFLLTEPLARERKVVLEWLQNSADRGPPIDEVVKDMQQNAERGDILGHGWLHTRHKIKLQKSVNAVEGVLDPNDPGAADSHLGSGTLVTQLDPDAMRRQGRRLVAQDEFFERAVAQGCFEMLRRGYTMKEIRDWCSVRTETWRAATIAPLALSNPEDEEQADFSPHALLLWRRMCHASAREGGTGDYDGAVYGLLGGDMASVEKVCSSWDDFMFLHYNALVRAQFDGFLVKRGGLDAAKLAERFPVVDAGLAGGKRLVAALEFDARTAKEASTIAKALQAAIISHDLDQHQLYQGIAVSIDANKDDESKLMPPSKMEIPLDVNRNKFFDLKQHAHLRISAHILVVVNTLDSLEGASRQHGFMAGFHETQNMILIAYMTFLRLGNMSELIPLYCTKLDSPRMYEVLSRNMINMELQHERQHVVAIMQKVGLDLAEFGRTIAQVHLEDVDDVAAECEAKFRILGGPPTLKYGRLLKSDFFDGRGDDDDKGGSKEDDVVVEPADEHIIRSLEWLMLIPGLFLETCEYVIAAYKYFLKRMHLMALRQLMERVPITRILAEKVSGLLWPAEDEELEPSFDDFVHSDFTDELLDELKATKEEVVATVKILWDLESLVRSMEAIEAMTTLANMMRRNPAVPSNVLNEAGNDLEKLKTFMQPVLKGCLMLDKAADPDYQQLRAAYLPEVVLAFVSCLQFAGTSLSRSNMLECMELAATLAEKNSDVAHEFIKCGRMKELLESFASCSKALAIYSSEKGSLARTKKPREAGWSRELWSVKS